MIQVQDIQNMQRKRRAMQQRGIDIVLARCYRTIESVTKTRPLADSCVFEVPEFVLGSPIYDLTECILFVKHNLEDNGFKVYYVFPRSLVVSWESAMKNISVQTQFDVKPSGKVVLSLL